MKKEISQEEFDCILKKLVTENASLLIHIPGIYEIVSEEFNNEVIEIWEAKSKRGFRRDK